jgi:hypothetical protein
MGTTRRPIRSVKLIDWDASAICDLCIGEAVKVAVLLQVRSVILGCPRLSAHTHAGSAACR